MYLKAVLQHSISELHEVELLYCVSVTNFLGMTALFYLSTRIHSSQNVSRDGRQRALAPFHIYRSLGSTRFSSLYCC